MFGWDLVVDEITDLSDISLQMIVIYISSCKKLWTECLYRIFQQLIEYLSRHLTLSQKCCYYGRSSGNPAFQYKIQCPSMQYMLR